MTDSRVRTRIPAEFKSEGLSGRGEVRNVSDGGLFVSTKSIPSAGSTAHVKLCAPGKVPVAVQGLVWWTSQTAGSRRSGFGLRILDDDESYQRLVAGSR
jgi:Tfp pilus assembly protein PilZ